MKIVVTFFILINMTSTFGQIVEIFGGLNNNKFYDNDNNIRHYSSSYNNSEYGFSAGAGYEAKSLKLKWYSIKFTLQYDNYGGKMEVSDGGLGIKYHTIANINKSLISFGFFPLNINVCRRIDIGIGFIVSRLIYESSNGTIDGWTMLSTWSNDLDDKFNSTTYYGFQGRIGYQIKLSESISIIPQYLYYYGFGNEFVEFNTKSMRHYFCIGLNKRLNK